MVRRPTLSSLHISFQHTIPDIFDPDLIKDIDPRPLIRRSNAGPSTKEKIEDPATPPPKRDHAPARVKPSDHKRKRESTTADDSGVYLDPPKKRRCTFAAPSSPNSKRRTKGFKLSKKENRTIDLSLAVNKPSRARSKTLWRPPVDSRLVTGGKPPKASFHIFPDSDAPISKDDRRFRYSQSISKISDEPERKTNQSIFPDYRATAPAAARPM